MTNNSSRYPHVTVYDQDINKFISAKKLWAKIRDAKLSKRLRASRLNPYHTNLNFYDAPKDEAIALAREKGDKTILFRAENGYKTRCYVELNCSVDEEGQKYGNIFRGGQDVTERIPRNKDGKWDLFAEEPIMIAIVPIEGPSLVGHVCMQYKDRVVNRRGTFMDNAPLWETYGTEAQYYAIYPSKLGLSPETIEREIENTNILRGERKYNIGNNNCADNVSYALKNCGVKDINFLGFDKIGLTLATPGNNPFGFGVKQWCQKNGVHLHPQEMMQYKYRTFGTAEKNKAEYAQKRAFLLNNINERT